MVSGFTKIAVGFTSLADLPDSTEAGLIGAALGSPAAGVYSATKKDSDPKKSFVQTAGGSMVLGGLGSALGAVGGAGLGLLTANIRQNKLKLKNKMVKIPKPIVAALSEVSRKYRGLRGRTVWVPRVMLLAPAAGYMLGGAAGRYYGAKKGHGSESLQKVSAAHDNSQDIDGRSNLKSVAAGAVGALGAGAAGYAALRAKRLKGGKVLRGIQKNSDRVVKIVAEEDLPGKGGKGTVGTLNWLKRTLDPNEYVARGKKMPSTDRAAVFDLDGGGRLKGSVNYTPPKVREAVKRQMGYDKKSEQAIIRRRLGAEVYIPTETTEAVAGLGGRLEKKISRLNRKYKNGWFIKERGGYGGMENAMYAHSGQDFKRDADARKFLSRATNKRGAKKHIVQPMQDIQHEFRVHVMGNQVIPGFTFNRNLGSVDTALNRFFEKVLPDEGSIKNLPVTRSLHNQVERKVSKALRNRHLPGGSNQIYGMDVAVDKGGKVKIIETNPADTSGYSGFLDHAAAPLARHADFYEAMTGRMAPYRAALGAAPVAAVGAVAGNAAVADKNTTHFPPLIQKQ